MERIGVLTFCLLFPVLSFAQDMTCSLHPDAPDRYMMCDGKVYSYQSEEKDRENLLKVQKLVLDNEMLREAKGLLEAKVRNLEQAGALYELRLSDWERHNEFIMSQVEFYRKASERPYKWWNSPGFHIATGAVVSLAFALVYSRLGYASVHNSR